MSEPGSKSTWDLIDFTAFPAYGAAKMDGCAHFTRSCVEKAIGIAKGLIEQLEKTSNGKNQNNNHDAEECDHNSLIAITGDRGSGKSTVMLSLINILKNNNTSQKDARDTNKSESNSTQEMTFPYNVKVLKLIDPTVFAEQEKLVGAVVSHIFNDVDDAVNKASQKIDEEQTRKVYAACDAVHSALKVIYTGVVHTVKDEPEGFETLEKLTATTLLRNKLHELFNAYLKWSGCVALVIPIDDLDMKIKGNFYLMEEIRNYLFKTDVIVIMSAKYEQLTDSIEQHFTTQLKGLPPSHSALDAQPAEMASKYLQKLMPSPRRVALPVLRPEAMGQYGVMFDGGEKNPPTGINLVHRFFDLIYRRTGIILVKNGDNSHGLLPSSLRALHHMFDMLANLKEVFNPDDEHKSLKAMAGEDEYNLAQNLQRVENWVLDSACSNSVPRGLARIAREFSTRPTEGLHAYLVKELDNYSAINGAKSCDGEKIIKSGLFGGDETIKMMLAPSALSENISIGDALYVLNRLESLNPAEGFCHFVAIIKMMYSIRMTRAVYLSNEADDPYRPLRRVLNGLVYNPRQRLTHNHYEWKSNVDYSGVSEELSAIFARTVCKSVNSTNTKPNRNRETEKAETKLARAKNGVAWRLLFAVGVGRIQKQDIHTIAETHPTARHSIQYTMTRFRKKSERGRGKGGSHPGPLFAQFNFLAVINNLLYPKDKFVDRVTPVFDNTEDICKLFTPYFGSCSNAKCEKCKDVLPPPKNNRVGDGKGGGGQSSGAWFMIRLFSLWCVEVIDAVVRHMHINADLRSVEDNSDDYYGSIHFKGALKDAVEYVFAKTLKKEYEELKKDEIPDVYKDAFNDKCKEKQWPPFYSDTTRNKDSFLSSTELNKIWGHD